jgi:hypothetical protein
MELMTTALQQRFKAIGSQSETLNPIIITKFFDPVGSGTWYVSEYEPETKICFGYVTGLGHNEWGYFSLTELEAIERPFGLTIERDSSFEEARFKDLKIE